MFRARFVFQCETFWLNQKRLILVRENYINSYSFLNNSYSIHFTHLIDFIHPSVFLVSFYSISGIIPVFHVCIFRPYILLHNWPNTIYFFFQSSMSLHITTIESLVLSQNLPYENISYNEYIIIYIYYILI